jgi:NAD(P)H-flavin reductase
MDYPILHKQVFKNGFQQIELKAEALVPYLFPGQFVFVMARAGGDRLPFSAFDIDPRREVLTIFFDSADDRSKDLLDVKVGDTLYSVSGPYGQALPFMEKKTVLCLGQGMGSLGVLPVCRYYSAHQNKVIAAFPLKTKSDLIHDAKLRVCCDKVVITTEDGSYDLRGGVADLVAKVASEKFDWIYADGSMGLYEDAIILARSRNIPVALNLLSHVREILPPFETSLLQCGDLIRFPAIDSCWVGAEEFSREVTSQQANKHKEYLAWRHSQSRSSPSRDEFGIFPKWFLDCLSRKP